MVYEKIVNGVKLKHIMGCWYTNIEHGRRHQPLQLMTYDNNLRYSKHKELKNTGYLKYDNYDAMDVPFVDAIPSDYRGVMGVPITFLGDYSPEQFEILGMASSAGYNKEIVGIDLINGHDGRPIINNKVVYARVFIRNRGI